MSNQIFICGTCSKTRCYFILYLLSLFCVAETKGRLFSIGKFMVVTNIILYFVEPKKCNQETKCSIGERPAPEPSISSFPSLSCNCVCGVWNSEQLMGFF